MAFLLSRTSIQGLLTMEECIDLVEKAFAELSRETSSYLYAKGPTRPTGYTASWESW